MESTTISTSNPEEIAVSDDGDIFKHILIMVVIILPVIIFILVIIQILLCYLYATRKANGSKNVENIAAMQNIQHTLEISNIDAKANKICIKTFPLPTPVSTTKPYATPRLSQEQITVNPLSFKVAMTINNNMKSIQDINTPLTPLSAPSPGTDAYKRAKQLLSVITESQYPDIQSPQQNQPYKE